MKNSHSPLLWLLIMLCISTFSYAKDAAQTSDSAILIIKGKVIEKSTSTPLMFATIGLKNTNLATVSNSEGHFMLKLPPMADNDVLIVSYVGHQNYEILVRDIKKHNNLEIALEAVSLKLDEINVFPDKPQIIINNILKNREKNYSTEGQLMTGFYRETIKKGRQYTALAEAVVEINKTAYSNTRKDQIRILKGRKGMNVSKMDTLLFKLQGGAHSTLAMDVIKYPYSILSPEVQDVYNYTFENFTKINGELHIVLSFKQKESINDPMFYGTLYVHAQTMAISNITFSLNTTNETLASAMLIKHKPFSCDAIPMYAHYIVNYRRQGDKWYYSYARGEIEFKIDWKKRLFNNFYTISSEMAITNRAPLIEKSFARDERLKQQAIMNETVEGFYDKDFWGKYNVIEPEKSIHSAIRKIAKNMENIK